MAAKPVVSVVIPAYGRTPLLRKAVTSLFDQDLPGDQYEILVVDGSPNDANERMIGELTRVAPCSLRYIRKPPEGPGPSRNMGARESSGEFIAFLDSDCFVTPEWLSAGIKSFADGVGIVQGRTLPDPEGQLGIFRWYLRVDRETFVYEAANIFYRREAFEEIRGFPSDLMPRSKKPMGGEDVEAAWLVKRKGWQTKFEEAALVYHEVEPLAVIDWVVIKRLYIWPSLLSKFPELRRYMYRSYFLDRPQAFFLLAVLGSLLGVAFHWAGFLLAMPYVIVRAAEPTHSLKGPLRVARVIAYMTRDIASFCLLTAGSIRYRCLLL